MPDIEETLGYVTGAVREIRRALTDGGAASVPLIGFSGSPWTLACYMVEGGGSDDFRTVKSMAYSRPDLMHRILDVNAQAVAAYLNAQIEAGAQAVMIFDTWAVRWRTARTSASLDYIRRVVSQLKREHDGERVPVITFTKGGGLWLEEIAATGVDAVGLDWTVNLGCASASRARSRCRATSTRRSCLRRRPRCASRRVRCSTAAATIRATYSTSGTVFRNSRRPITSPNSSTKYIATAARSVAEPPAERKRCHAALRRGSVSLLALNRAQPRTGCRFSACQDFDLYNISTLQRGRFCIGQSVSLWFGNLNSSLMA